MVRQFLLIPSRYNTKRVFDSSNVDRRNLAFPVQENDGPAFGVGAFDGGLFVTPGIA
jgi:hypothetical protein